jgi:LPS-assembly protein
VPINNPSNNLKVTDFSFVWPTVRDISIVGKWDQNWNHRRLQNLIYGLQYNTCCFAVRLVGGKAFLGFDPTNNNKPLYDSQFYLQFSLKGLGDVGSGDPSGLLNSITGYNPQFGQEF